MAPTLALLAVAAWCTSVFALPNSKPPQSSGGLEERDNSYHLICGNAPGYVGGFPVPANVGLTLPAQYPTTGSNKEAYNYMYCTPGTSTYMFFQLPEMTPPPLDDYSVAQAFNMTQTSFSNQADQTVPEGSFTVNPAGTNVQVHMENSGKNGQLTWGIVESALSGLGAWATEYNNACNAGYGACNPIVFQVNDGQWGEVGIGYAAYYEASDDKCVLQIEGGNKAKYTYCSDLKKIYS